MGSDGSTTLSLTGKARLNLDDLAKSPFEIHAEASNLELDTRIRRWIPEENRELWDAYFPQVIAEPSKSAGRVNIVANARRLDPAAKVDYAVDIKCLDVSMKYRHFAYPVDHIQGLMKFTPGKMSLKVWTFIGNQPLVVEGDVNDPGPNAEANLVFDVASLPIDDVLRNALPREVRETVDRFKPTGSVRGKARLHRLPPLKKGDDPRGRVTFDALIDLNPGCSVTWEGLTYPVMNLIGRLEIHPNRWIFHDMKGKNGQAEIRADGEVEKLDRNVFKVRRPSQGREPPVRRPAPQRLAQTLAVDLGHAQPDQAPAISTP